MLPALLVSGLLISIIIVVIYGDNLSIPIKDILLAFLWGAGLSGLANWGFIIATRHLIAAEVTIFMLLEFSLGPVWVWLFINEIPTAGTIWGGILVILSVITLVMYELRKDTTRLKRGRPSPP